ncbi:TLD-domain-containing protein [Gorgonomyces haynaldii]|nr:TLD-domain-containing protein [Gorgonomyces haynaldii]
MAESNSQPLFSLLVNTASSVVSNIASIFDDDPKPDSLSGFVRNLVYGTEIESEPSHETLPESTPTIPDTTQEPVAEEQQLEQEALVNDELPLLNVHLMKKIHPYLPPLLREAEETVLLYSLDEHGISINTLYKQTSEKGSCLIVIKDDNQTVFGGFCSDSLEPQTGFHGNGSCFLFTTVSGFQVYKATGKNDYLVLSEQHCIAFGGGQGKFGLWMDDQLLNGHSEPCATFGNIRLSKDAEFKIVHLEIWGFRM